MKRGRQNPVVVAITSLLFTVGATFLAGPIAVLMARPPTTQTTMQFAGEPTTTEPTSTTSSISTTSSSAAPTSTSTSSPIPTAPTTTGRTPTTSAAPDPTPTEPAATTTILAAPTTIPIAFSAAAETAIATDTNQLRATLGLPLLAGSSTLHDFARSCAMRVAEAQVLAHSDLSSLLRIWTMAGEVLGMGGEPGPVFDALVASPSHYSILADPLFTDIGVGAAVDASGALWICGVFGGTLPTTLPPLPEVVTTTTTVTFPDLRPCTAWLPECVARDHGSSQPCAQLQHLPPGFDFEHRC